MADSGAPKEETYLIHCELTFKDYGDGNGGLLFCTTETVELEDLKPAEHLHALGLAVTVLEEVFNRTAVAYLGEGGGAKVWEIMREKWREHPPMSWPVEDRR